ncbi:MAG: glutamate decarboxylase [Chloroflexota bacterium]|jgi:glutamate decarboxylase|nr:glutamate decarboxylase [Chloroflexota bacterium]
MLSKKVQLDDLSHQQQHLASSYGSRYISAPVPKYDMPEEQMPANIAYQIIHDEMNLDGNPAMNLATFVTTWMEPEADKLFIEAMGKNYIDADEYPQSTEIQNRCVNMLARLFNAPPGHDAIGTATVGSSEAIHLAGLALKWNWRKRRAAAGKPTDRPNLVMSHSVQVCWEKFARYFDVEPRYVPNTLDRFVIGVDEAMQMVDENTIAVVGILGSTYNGQYEDIKGLNDALVALNEKTGWDVPIHVDGASGAFVAPFLEPELEWDFRLPLVRSINASGHKYGLVYPGVGWVIWRDETHLPEELIFHVNYLGGDQPSFTLNFSRGASQIIAQYYNFLRLGRAGYREIMLNLQDTARFLATAITDTGHFDLVSDDSGLPLVCFSLQKDRPYSVFDVSDHLRSRGWVVPAYSMAPDAEEVSVLRVVVREGLSRDMAELLVADIHRTVDHLDRVYEGSTKQTHHKKRSKKKTKAVC